MEEILHHQECINLVSNWINYQPNWLAGFLNHGQYQEGYSFLVFGFPKSSIVDSSTANDVGGTCWWLPWSTASNKSWCQSWSGSFHPVYCFGGFLFVIVTSVITIIFIKSLIIPKHYFFQLAIMLVLGLYTPWPLYTSNHTQTKVQHVIFQGSPPRHM